SIDLSGDALHRRGYREAGVQVEAPLKETLAAAILLFGGWPEIAASGGALIDPVCGSGTLLVEGALIAGDRAPGLLRSRWGFDGWLGHDEAAWHELLDEADGRAEAGLAAIPPILGVDIDPRAIEVATACIARAGLAGSVEVRLADLRSLQPPVSQGTDPLPPGLIVANPPYGERIGQGEDLAALYGALGTRAREQFPGYGFALITSDDALAEAVRLPLESTHRVYNGRVPAAVRLFRVPRRSVAVEVSADSMFANRLRKNVRHIGKWARRTATTCYRVYDADMPEYAVAVDRYAGAGPDEGRIWAHVAEYAPPREIDPVAAERRLAEVMAAVPAVLGISPDDVHLKVRTRQKGDAQYERFAARGVFSIVAEDGLLFEVNLTDYLDTGLFLDHRITRGMIREMAEGARFLNLFAYTGAATVHAAAGGARSTLTVDLSATYLEWADHNMALNGFTGPAHVRHRADVLEWIGSSEARDAGPFDLIFCDPPTFSTSKRMESTLDVQRDHAGMLVALEALLAPGGTIVFSNNFRRFRMDHGALSRAGLVATDITAATIPQDFARNPKIHTTWNVTRADER
ncbi:MAG: bifunctional 23S rRNA (guanine(2069)-N(7))-methyltransferase RlmK/23S rRNA (guanine(2445)-N(2))-methyltransferase RlmL, partial [Coriobacteriia bacterium]|nr:bifunctional 23S rRNA (guanine(2069)-N(7))-methyltransferase RlmK/23S rRNA (guanine(2445)-N(2))-methyltransferase RlmL [Coriobacteriia bacterium]